MVKISESHLIKTENSQFKAGYVAVVGRPNVGKSTLINTMLNFPLSITTPKPQTTRHRILGILSEENVQILFLDTPGLIEPQYKLQSLMMKAAYSALQDADVILFLVPASNKAFDKDIKLLQTLKNLAPVVLVINKIDTLEKKLILPLIDNFRKLYDFIDIVPISALQKINVTELKLSILSQLPYAPPFYPPDQITKHPERFFVTEMIRESIFRKYSDEIPFSTAVVIDEFREQKGKKDYIKARIIVEKGSQKKIIVGKNGQAIRNVGQLARKAIEEFLDRPVYLDLWVSVRENWRKKDVYLKEFGYDDK